MEQEGAPFAGAPPPVFGVPHSEASMGGMDVDDPELARAIEASYAAQTSSGMAASETDLIEQAVRLSKLEEEARQRREAGLPEDDDAAAAIAAAAAAAAEGDAARGWASADVPGSRPSSTVMPPSSLYEDDLGLRGVVAGESSRASSVDPLAGHLHAPGMDVEAMRPDSATAAAAVAADEEMNDRQLAMAIEASYAAQTETGMAANEEDLMAQALRISKMEEDSRQRASLREEQEMELQESMLMDQMREQEERRRRQEEEEAQALEASRREEEETRKRVDEEQKRARIPPEPPAGEPGRADFMIRTSDGRRIRRAFRGTDTVGQVYDYLDIEGGLGELKYRLVSTMPRRAYEDREQTLSVAGLQGQCALMIEAIVDG